MHVVFCKRKKSQQQTTTACPWRWSWYWSLVTQFDSNSTSWLSELKDFLNISLSCAYKTRSIIRRQNGFWLQH